MTLARYEDDPYIVFDREEFVQFLRELSLSTDDVLDRHEIELPAEVRL